MTTALRLAVLPDFVEEGWPSMDGTADGLIRGLRRNPSLGVVARVVRPRWRALAGGLVGGADSRTAKNLDRLWNRHVSFPRCVRRLAIEFDAFHIADHSYAHLALALPADRTGVYCHDLDAFRCLLEPRRDPRPAWYRALAARTLRGLRRAAVVFHATETLRDEILRLGVVRPERLVAAPYGRPVDHHGAAGVRLPEWAAGRPFLLHVGSCVPRKGIDVLLATVARARRTHPDVRLVQIGGRWTDDHEQLLEHLDLEQHVVQRRGLPHDELAALYRHASAVLLPSTAEGFGLPLIEALAAGAIPIVSDLPVFREVAAGNALLVEPGDLDTWAACVTNVLTSTAIVSPCEQRITRGRSFDWETHAETVAATYSRLTRGPLPEPHRPLVGAGS